MQVGDQRLVHRSDRLCGSGAIAAVISVMLPSVGLLLIAIFLCFSYQQSRTFVVENLDNRKFSRRVSRRVPMKADVETSLVLDAYHDIFECDYCGATFDEEAIAEAHEASCSDNASYGTNGCANVQEMTEHDSDYWFNSQSESSESATSDTDTLAEEQEGWARVNNSQVDTLARKPALPFLYCNLAAAVTMSGCRIDHHPPHTPFPTMHTWIMIGLIAKGVNTTSIPKQSAVPM